MASIVEQLELIKQETGVPYSRLCCAASLPYRNLMRWKQRMENGIPVVEKTGPKKVVKPDMGQLQQDIISKMQHRQHRSLGATRLYEQYREQVSRRELQHLVEMTRREKQADKLQRMRRITWNVPGLVWSMDDLEYDRNADRSRLFLHHEMDLAARFCFPPTGSTGGVLAGTVIAKLLAERFERYGAPLFLKRDNGGNLNHSDVNDVLSKYYVLPLNSPAHYPPYNGGMERMQREILDDLHKRLYQRAQLVDWMIEDAAGNVVHDLNHKRRRLLSGKAACGVFSERKGGEYPLRQREQIYELLTGMTSDILAAMEETGRKTHQAAWRMAVEIWLQNQGHITVSMNGKVLPYSFSFLCHK